VAIVMNLVGVAQQYAYRRSVADLNWKTICRILRSIGVLSALLSAGALTYGAEITRTTSFDYDLASGLLTKEIVEPAQSRLCVVTEYSLDEYGHKKSTTKRACNGSAGVVPGFVSEAPAPAAPGAFESRTSYTKYSDDKRFPAVLTNSLNQDETRTYDGRFGGVLSVVDANGVSSSTTYDTLGRKILETKFDGTKTKWAYIYCTNGGQILPSGAIGGDCTSVPTINGVFAPRYYIQSTPLRIDGVSANGPYTKTYYDAVDRIVRTETQGFDGVGSGRLVYEDILYDQLGRVTRKSRPYYAGDASFWIFYTFDDLGRALSVSSPVAAGTATSRKIYSGLTTVTLDPLGRATTEIKNVAGQVVRVVDSKDNILQFAYDPAGNVVQTIDPKGNTISLVYDNRGRKTASYDPDMGAWTFVYNALGELVQQVDAKGQITTLAYDLFGRMVGRNEPSLNSSWSFDTYADGSPCVYGKGKVCETRAGNGYNSKNAYDVKGRLKSTATSIGADYTASLSYDTSSGRIDTQTYPSGMQVRTTYTSLGYPWKITDLRTNTDLWTSTGVDAGGRPLQYTYGNGISTSNAYYADGRLSTTQAGTGNLVQNLSFSYDLAGNLTARIDLLNGVTAASYTYDELNRVSSETRSGGGLAAVEVISWAFDSTGNMTSRSEGGSKNIYNYPSSGSGSRRPHAVASVSGFVNGYGVPIYLYDANGNLTAGAGRTVTWTSFDTVASLSSNGLQLDYLYDADYQRIKESYYVLGNLQRNTLYLNPAAGTGLFYEEESGVAGLQRKHYVSAGGRTVAMVVQDGSNWRTQYWHEDHLGSVSAVSDENRTVVERMAYEPFGKRRNANGTMDTFGMIKPVSTDRGYTEHEHIDELGLINMNGRVYDPGLGRFMSADPTIQAPTNLQSYNRYSYAWNNPLGMVDPTGFNAQCAWDGAACGDEMSAPNMGPDVDVPGFVSLTADSTKLVEASVETSSSEVSDKPTTATEPKLGFVAAKERGDAIRDLRVAFDRARGLSDIPGMEAAYQGYMELSGGLQDPASHMRLEAWGNVILRAQIDAGRNLDKTVLQNTAAVGAFMLGTSAPPGGAKGAAPPNLSPAGAGRAGAFNAAKRQSGIPTSQQPNRVLPNVDRRGNRQPGRIYEFEVPAPGGGTRTVRIRDDAGGHDFGPGNSQNRGSHFNDAAGNHYDY